MRLLILLVISHAYGSPIINMSAACDIHVNGHPPIISQIGTDSCVLNGSFGAHAEASNQAGYIPQVSASEYAKLLSTSHVSATYGWNTGNESTSLVATIRASDSITETLATTGPLRNGLIQINAGIGYGAFNDTAGNDGMANYSIGPISGNYVMGDCTIGDIRSCQGVFAFILGTPFNIMASTYAASTTAGFSNFSSSFSVNLPLQFRFMELDGTPVPIIHNPEPYSAVLLGMGLLLIIGSRVLHKTMV